MKESVVKSQLLDRIDSVCRRKGYARTTAKTYRYWCGKFLLWLKASNGGTWQHPDKIGRAEIEQWLTHLATAQNVAPTSQNRLPQAG
jgi:site-specific recombinase XerD